MESTQNASIPFVDSDVLYDYYTGKKVGPPIVHPSALEKAVVLFHDVVNSRHDADNHINPEGLTAMATNFLKDEFDVRSPGVRWDQDDPFRDPRAFGVDLSGYSQSRGAPAPPRGTPRAPRVTLPPIKRPPRRARPPRQHDEL